MTRTESNRNFKFEETSMKSTRTIISNALILTLILAGSMVFAQNPPEIERALQVQGARLQLDF